MPITTMATLSGRVSSSYAPQAIFLGQIEGGGATFEGTVSRAAVDSIDGLSIAYGLRVVLDGEEIPPSELAGPVEFDESIDSVVVTFSFTLAGRRWLPLLTSRTWTRTPVQVYTSTAWPGGPPREELRASGVVVTCDPEDALKVKISCSNEAILYDQICLCHEVPPGSGLHRGEICAELAAFAGLTQTDFPQGAVFNKPWITDSRTLWDALKAFVEPEGWSLRLRPDGTLEAYSAVLKPEAEPPDFVWTSADVVSVGTSPPEGVPSRWVIRGTVMVTSDETGVSTRITRTEVQALYAAKVAVSRQLSDGEVVDAGVSEDFESLRTISIVEDIVAERAGLTIEQVTREWGWYNPLAAKLRTPSAGEPAGPVEEGFYPCQAWIDADGTYRAWPREQFVQLSEKRQRPSYSPEGTLLGSRTMTFKWHTRTMGVRHTGSETLDIAGAGVGSDDQSYWVWEAALSSLRRIEGYELAEMNETRYEYGPAGAVRVETQDVWRWYSPRTSVTANPWFITYSGAGQLEVIAGWKLFRRQVVTNVLATDGHLLGKIEATLGYGAAKRVSGGEDWGDMRSGAKAESWRTLGVKTTGYNVLSEELYEETGEDAEGPRTPILVSGRTPLPRFKASSWTRMTQAPLELLLEDSTALAWFGDSSEVVSLEFVQDLSEALAVADRRRARKMALTHDVVRPVTLARPGATVLLVHPETGINHRALVTKLKETWSLSRNGVSVLASYTLEQPL